MHAYQTYIIPPPLLFAQLSKGHRLHLVPCVSVHSKECGNYYLCYYDRVI